jgi:hypothetical protein
VDGTGPCFAGANAGGIANRLEGTRFPASSSFPMQTRLLRDYFFSLSQ